MTNLVEETSHIKKVKVSISFFTLKAAQCAWLAGEGAQDTSQEFLKMPISRAPHRCHDKIFFLCSVLFIAKYTWEKCFPFSGFLA